MITLPPFLEVIEALKEIEFCRTDLPCLQEFSLCPSKKQQLFNDSDHLSNNGQMATPWEATLDVVSS